MKKTNKSATKVFWHKRNGVKALLEAVAGEKDGIAGVEFDVVGTKDGVPMLMHDKILTRTLMQDGHYMERPLAVEVGDMDAAELRELRPDLDTLKEGLQAIKAKEFSDDFEFHLEIKSPNAKLVDNVLAILDDYPRIEKQTTIRSFQESVLQQVRKARPNKGYCLLLEGKKTVDPDKDFITTGKTAVEKLPDFAGVVDICGFEPIQVSVEYHIITDKFVKAMQKVGVEVEVYTLNDISGLKGIKVDRITTDEPIKIIEQITKSQKAKL